MDNTGQWHVLDVQNASRGWQFLDEALGSSSNPYRNFDEQEEFEEDVDEMSEGYERTLADVLKLAGVNNST